MKSVRLQLLVTLAAVVTAGVFLAARGRPPSVSLEQAVQWNMRDQIGRDIRWRVDAVEPESGISFGSFDRPLHQAAMKGYADAVEYLLDKGWNINAVCNNALLSYGGETPLYLASLHGRLEVVQLLLRRGAEYEGACFSPMHGAVKGGHLEVARTLLGYGLDPNAFEMKGPPPPLVTAVEKRDMPMIRLLLESGARVQATEDEVLLGMRLGPADALSAAVINKDREMIDFLLGVDPDVDRTYALRTAALARDIELVQFLIDRKTRLRGPDAYQVFSALAPTGDEAILRLLIAHGADVDATQYEDHGLRPLHNVVSEGLPAVRLLVELGADVNAKGEFGQRPLHRAVLFQATDVARFLVEKGANVNGEDDRRRTPVFSATTADMVRLLVSLGADVRRRGRDGGTALHEVVSGEDRAEAVRALLEAGADANAKNHWNSTPLAIAEQDEQPEVAALLRQYGARK
ncbi:MAG: ankyrin repeat domain-containing protein [Planctomycetes bacterium]|nr:ankyrin repeat domain-containing protein [Planctomycetota bacterium]